MRTRLIRARLTHVAFLGAFGLYVAAAVVWLTIGLAPALVNLVPSLHDTLHRWGGGEQTVYAEISDWNGALEQRQAWAPWATETRELTFQASTQTVIHFQNNETDEPHNISIYADPVARAPLFRGQIVAGPATDEDEPPRAVYRFTAPGPGTYSFRCDIDPTMNGIVRVVDERAVLDSPALAEIARGIAKATHVSEPIHLVALQYLFSVVNLCLGILLVRLRPHDRAARLLALGMVGTGAVFNLQSHSVEYLAPLVSQIHEMFHWVAGVAYVGALLLFPDAKLFLRWSKPRWFKWPLGVIYLVFFACVGFMFGSTIHGDPVSFIAFFGVIIPITGITSQAVRARRARTAEERQLSRVLTWGLALPFAMALLLGLFALIAYGASSFGPSERPVEGLKRFVFLIFPPLFAVIPVVLFAIMARYRLWDIDRVINRALVYGLLTGILGLTYLVSVILLGSVLTLVVGQRANGLVVAAATLAVAAAFRPVRRWVQALIDRRFDRGTYDATQALAAFGAVVGDEVDLRRLNAELLTVVERTLQPSRVVFWLPPSERDERQDRPTSDTSTLDLDPDDPLVAHLRDVSGAVDLDKLRLESPAVRQMMRGGIELVVPLTHRGGVIGVLALGPRRGRQPYTVSDRAFLTGLAAQMAPAVRLARMVRQQQAEAQARERIEQELRVARLIQQTLLPKAVPDLPGWRLATDYRPARAVGGDFYDFLDLADGRLGLVIGDVTSKGVPAALVMATTRSVLRATALRLPSPGQVLAGANEILCPDMPPHMFVTCFYAVLEPATGRLTYANAGHPLPFRRRDGGLDELRATGMPLGLMSGARYEEREIRLTPGESVLFYSDGLVEAHDRQNEMLGLPRLRQCVAAYPKDGMPLIDYLIAEFARFTGADWEPEDDVTLVTLERDALGEHAQATSGDGRRTLTEWSLASEPGNERCAEA